MLKNKAIRTWGIVGIVVIVVLFAVRAFSPANASEATSAVTAEVVSLTVAETIDASGSLAAQPFAALAWKTSGVIETVHVQPGDQVKAGDILMSLQVSSAPANIISAQTDLVNAQQDLDTVLHSTLAYATAQQSLADAKQAVEDAQKDVTKLDYRRASDDLIDQTEAEIDLANKQVSMAEDAYKRVQNRPDGDSLKAQALLNLTNARLNRDEKQATLDWYLGTPSDLDAETYQAALAIAEAQLADAQREVERLKDGPNPADVRAAQARVDAAQATVNSLYIIAPFDGEVLSVEQSAGDVVNINELAINLANLNKLYVETQVDESDIANVQLGDQVSATLDALSSVALTGQVTAINPVGEVVSGLVKYKVRVDLDPVDEAVFLPLGSTVNVTIHIGEAEARLAVPITAIQNDTDGEFVMLALSDGATRRVKVVSGAIKGDLVVVSGSLQAGDSVLLSSGAGFEAPNPFGGGDE